MNKFYFIFVLLLIVAFEFVDSCASPNGTESAIHFFNCKENLPISVTKVEIFDADGNSMYPLNPKKPITIQVSAVNNGNDYESVKIDANLFSFNRKKCSWSEVYTFELMNNLDGCKFTQQCPIKNGNFVIEKTMNFSIFGGLLGFLFDKGIYQLEMKAFGSNGEEIGCAISQFQLAT